MLQVFSQTILSLFLLQVWVLIFTVSPYNPKTLIRELLVNLTLYQLAALSALFLWLSIATLLKGVRFRLWCVSALLFCFLSPLVLQPYAPFLFADKKEISNGGETFSVLSFNIRYFNSNFSEIQAVIEAANPDILALLEYSPEAEDALSLDFPYRVSLPSDGIGLFSRYPFVQQPKTSLGGETPSIVFGSVEIADREIFVAALHAMPPKRKEALHVNELLYRRLAVLLRHDSRAALIFGDFNATPSSLQYVRLREGAKLRHAAEGFGLYRTWNARNYFFRIPVDHILYRGALQVKDFKTLPAAGSDHFPVYAQFLLLSEEEPR